MSGDGMQAFVTALTDSQTGITPDNLWASLTQLAPFIAGMTIFAFGVWAVRKALKKAGKGKNDI